MGGEQEDQNNAPSAGSSVETIVCDNPAEGDERKGEVKLDESEVLSSPPSPGGTARESRLGRLERLKRLSIEM
jgi:hypothetical protein